MVTLILFRGLQFLCGRENSMYQCSVLELGYNQPTSEQAQAVCEFVSVQDVASCFSESWGQKWGSLLLLSLATDTSMVGKRCWLLESKATQPIEQQAENRSDNCILGDTYSFVGHAFVTRNSNQTTRRSLPGGMDGREQNYFPTTSFKYIILIDPDTSTITCIDSIRH